MSTLATASEKVERIEALTVDNRGAEVLTGLSYKTIERAADRGEPVGRLRVGRKVLYMRASLAKWLASKATTPTEIGA
jgi:phage terminase Nu1 subunit (DNA packaging protein)